MAPTKQALEAELRHLVLERNHQHGTDMRLLHEFHKAQAEMARIHANILATQHRLAELANGPAKAIEFAKAHLGWHEIGATNRAAWLDKWEEQVGGYVGQPWCQVFVNESLIAGGGPVIHSGYTVEVWNWANAGQNGFKRTTCRPGAWAYFNFHENADPTNHVGLVISADSHTIEGNTSNGNPSDGGSVELKLRPASVVAGYVWPPYPA